MEYQQKKKEASKKEFERLNKWDETAGISVEQQRRAAAEQFVNRTAKKDKLLQRRLNVFNLSRETFFDVAEGQPVQEFVPAKKARCRNAQQRQMERSAQEKVQQLAEQNGTTAEQVQKRVDGNSSEIQRNIIEENLKADQEVEAYRQLEDRPDFEVMRRFSAMDPQLIDDYSSNRYLRRVKYLRWMTDSLLEQDVTPEYFTPEYLAKSGGVLYNIVMRFKAFETVYNDPINKPYFDGLSEPEKKLVKVRILDMAKLYENALRLQCKNCGIRMEDGQYLSDDTLLAPTEEEKAAQNSFKSKVEQRNRLTREAFLEGYTTGVQEKMENLEQAGFVVDYAVRELQEVKETFAQNQDNYEANKPLLDLMEQEFFHVLDAGAEYIRRNEALKNFAAATREKGYQTVTDVRFERMAADESRQNTVAHGLFSERLNALKEAMRIVAEAQETDNPLVQGVVEEFRQKLQVKDTALMKQIDQATAGWADRRLDLLEDETWRAHEHYTGQEDLATYLPYTSGFDRHMYTDQLSDKLRLFDTLQMKVDDEELPPLSHPVQTTRGEIKGLNVARMPSNMQILTVTSNLTLEQAEEAMEKIATGEMGAAATMEKDQAVEQGLRTYKDAIFVHLKGLEAKYGKLLTQLHPEDVMRRVNIHELGMEMQLMQDMVNLTDNNATGIELFRDDNPMDVKYKALASYFFEAFNVIILYVQTHQMNSPMFADDNREPLLEQMEKARELEDGVEEGPSLKSSQMPYYTQSVRARYGGDSNPLRNVGYGRW